MDTNINIALLEGNAEKVMRNHYENLDLVDFFKSFIEEKHTNFKQESIEKATKNLQEIDNAINMIPSSEERANQKKTVALEIQKSFDFVY